VTTTSEQPVSVGGGADPPVDLRQPAGTTVRIPAERYTSPGFAALEVERLWPRTWVVACSVDHVHAPGDVFEHRVGPYSVLVVRGDDGELRAFQNHCRHRGNALCQGAATGLSELRCGYHRWSWDLQGRLREVPSRHWFGGLRNEELPLVPARVESWGPLVFVNLAADAPPLAEYLGGMADDIAWLGVDDFRCVAMVDTPVEANWKVVVDGFSETYHIQGLHPEMLASIDDVDTAQRVWGHTSASWQDYAVPSPRLRGSGAGSGSVSGPVGDQAVWDSFVATQGGRMGVEEPCPVPPLGDGETVRDAIASRIRDRQAAAGVDLSGFDTARMLRMTQYNLFPNTTLTIFPDLFTVLSARPGPSPDRAEFVVIHYQRAAGPDAPRTRPVTVTLPPEQFEIGLVLGQDVAAVAGVQRGLSQPGCTELVVSGEECRLVNTHRLLERYLGVEGTVGLAGPAAGGAGGAGARSPVPGTPDGGLTGG
jgi:phenylpropionate dioxygenase-like ring-hydroxylating dioxygenase large terminal subunit